ncbi:RBBP9/YdeN family alpha/beta hydrolase [Motilimonas eburnea]|uniref:RBBP9/YdeN family alpha/beta hydrolase n=1 Tax=Motilimonas eburnea TaxID=1737488 RepID=UPI001E2C216D|nr:alpha/beta fold hydrolase [Motilimonas eburnea]MCE2570454.1 alpha/beta hydrolase [Motilimonas eburnea]
MTITIVNVPGYTNAGPQHWQTYIEKKFKHTVRVQQQDWLSPVRQTWIDGLEQTLSQVSGKVVLVGHSCGANTIVQWAQQHNNANVIGALLVAPADIDSASAVKAIQVQRPQAIQALWFPSILAYSDNDAHARPEVSEHFAQCWGSELAFFKGADHFHTEAGFGDWPAGDALIEQLAGQALARKTA